MLANVNGYPTIIAALGAAAILLSVLLTGTKRDAVLVATGTILATRFGILYTDPGSDSGQAGILYSVLVAICTVLLLLRHPQAVRNLISANGYLVLFIVWTGVSLLWAADLVLALGTVLRLWVCIAFGITLAAVGRSGGDGRDGSREFAAAARPMQVVMTLALCLSLALSVVAPSLAYPQGAGRLAGLWNWNSAIGGVSALVLVSQLARVVLAPKGARLQERWAMLAGAIALVTLLMSGSATWIAGTAAAVLALALVRISNSLVRFLIVVSGAFGLWAASNLIDAATRILDRDPTMTGRTLLWDEALTVIARRPWLGQGPGGLAEGAGVGRTGAFHVHNSYLQATMDYGYIGVLLLMLALAVGLYRLFRSRRYEHLVLLTAVLVAASANSLITHPGIALVIIAWVLAAPGSPQVPRDRPRVRGSNVIRGQGARGHRYPSPAGRPRARAGLAAYGAAREGRPR